MSLQTSGGLAAILAALTYLVGFALMITVLGPIGYGTVDADPLRILAWIAENPAVMMLWNLTIYVVNAIALLVLVVALSARFRSAAPALAQVSRAFGGLWATLVLAAGMVANVGLTEVLHIHQTDPARAVEVWQIVNIVENGLGGGNEIAGGVWALTLGLAAYHAGGMSRLWSGASIAIGLSGLLTVVPQLNDTMGAVFGLGFIVWFLWTGVVLLRSQRGSERMPA